FAVANESKLPARKNHLFLLQLLDDCEDRTMQFHLPLTGLLVQQLSAVRCNYFGHHSRNGHSRRRIRRRWGNKSYIPNTRTLSACAGGSTRCQTRRSDTKRQPRTSRSN